MKTIHVGLLGYGLGGSIFHAPLIEAIEGLQLSEVSTTRYDDVHRRYPRATIYREPEKMLCHGDVDVVVVTTPNHLHFEHARRALECGRHVVIDKPFTVTTTQADELIDLASERGLLITAFQNRRWDGDFRTVRLLVKRNRLGLIRYFESTFDRFRPVIPDRWRERDLPGAGLLFDLGPHLVDQAVVLFGTPRWVQARIEAQREGAVVDDFFHLVLGYDGRTVVLRAGTLVRDPGPRFRIEGHEGTFIKYGLDPQEAALRAGGSPLDPGFGEDAPASYGRIISDIDGLVFDGHLQTLPGRYVDFYHNLARALRGECPPPVLAEDARDVIRILEAARESDSTGRRIHLQDLRSARAGVAPVATV